MAVLGDPDGGDAQVEALAVNGRVTDLDDFVGGTALDEAVRDRTRRPLLLIWLLDASGSMREWLARLEEVVPRWIGGIERDSGLAGIVELAVLTFNGTDGVRQLDPATGLPAPPGEFGRHLIAPVGRWKRPVLVAHGGTPLDSALERALDLHTEYLAHHAGDNPYQPVLWICSDGLAADEHNRASTAWQRHVDDLRLRADRSTLLTFAAAPAHRTRPSPVLEALAPGATVPLNVPIEELLQLMSMSLTGAKAGQSARAVVQRMMRRLGATTPEDVVGIEDPDVG